MQALSMGSSRRGVLLAVCCWVLVHGLGHSAQEPPALTQEITQHFRAGQQDMQAQRFDEATVEFKQVLRLRPGLIEARVNLGLAYHALGDYRLAVSELSRVVQEKPGLLSANLFLGISYLRLGFPDKAVPPLRLVLSNDPSNREAARSLATAELLRNNYHDAAFQFRKLSASDPDQADAWFTLGHDYLEMAKRLTAELSSQFGDSAWSLRLAGDVLAERHLWNDAAAAYRRALRADPSQPGLHGAIAEVLFEAGKTAQAEVEQAREKELHSSPPANQAVASQTGRTSSPAGCETDGDAQLCAKSLESQKRPPFADLMRVGRTLLARGDDEAASDALAAAFGQNPRNPESMYWLGRCYLRSADACFNRLTALHPDSWRAHELKAEEFQLRQAGKEALVEYRAAERLNPDDAKIHEAQGEILLNQNALPEARSQLETALRLNPAAPRSLYLMGSLYVAERDPAKGIPYLEAALHYDPTLMEARPVLGKAYLKTGKPGLAVAQLERSADIDRYGDLHYLLYEAYREEGKLELSAKALARSQELRRKSATDDQARIRMADEE